MAKKRRKVVRKGRKSQTLAQRLGVPSDGKGLCSPSLRKDMGHVHGLG